MSERLGVGGRVFYVMTGIFLFSLGCLFLAMFGAIITVPLGFALWFFAFKFIVLAVQGRTYSDWDAEVTARKELDKLRKEALVKEKMTELV